MKIEDAIIKTGLTAGGSFAAYKIGHGVVTYLTKLLEAGEIAGGLAVLGALYLGYRWAKRN